MNKQHHYIYFVSIDNIIVYIGKGAKGRYKHPLSGSSHILDFNRMYFNNESHRIKSEPFQWFFTDKEAIEAEDTYIKLFRPKYNIASLNESNERYCINILEIDKHKIERIYSKNRITTKPNFKKLCQEYTILQDKMNANCTQQEYDEYRCRRDEILLCSDDLFRYLGVLSYDRLSANGYNKQRLEKEYRDTLFLKNDDLVEYMSLEINKSYCVEDLKYKIQSFYDCNGVDKKAKTTDLDIFYQYKKTSLTGNVYGIKILGMK